MKPHRVVSLIIALIGYALLVFYGGWAIAIGVYFATWANNIDLLKKHN